MGIYATSKFIVGFLFTTISGVMGPSVQLLGAHIVGYGRYVLENGLYQDINVEETKLK